MRPLFTAGEGEGEEEGGEVERGVKGEWEEEEVEEGEE